jgi:hypothetical protein
MKKWTLDEYEILDEMYDDQVTYANIVEILNKNFHEGKLIRTLSSVNHAINRLYNTDIMDKLIEEQESSWKTQ